jgi:3-isopropylmalate/(R)-2-methylmalate dehydratase large subunit
MKVPSTIRFVLNGTFAPAVSAKDLMLYLIGQLGADGCGYKSAEFYGDAIPQMSISERMTVANLAMEMGSKCVFIPPDAATVQYLTSHGLEQSAYRPVYADADAVYERELTIDLSRLEPMVACPHQVENTKPISAVVGTRIDQAFLGSCANGKYEDLVVAAKILKGRRVDPRVRFIVTPGSKQIMLEAMNSGVLQSLIESGALVTNPGCGACAGDGGMMADGEVSLSTANRNFVGRMGSSKSSIYLSSPATLAASAIKGALADPREFI